MKRVFHFAALASFLCFLVVGCSAPIDFGAASSAVKNFHSQLNGQDYAAIYNNSDQRFRECRKTGTMAKSGKSNSHEIGISNRRYPARFSREL